MAGSVLDAKIIAKAKTKSLPQWSSHGSRGEHVGALLGGLTSRQVQPQTRTNLIRKMRDHAKPWRP